MKVNLTIDLSAEGHDEETMTESEKKEIVDAFLEAASDSTNIDATVLKMTFEK